MIKSPITHFISSSIPLSPSRFIALSIPIFLSIYLSHHPNLSLYPPLSLCCAISVLSFHPSKSLSHSLYPYAFLSCCTISLFLYPLPISLTSSLSPPSISPFLFLPPISISISNYLIICLSLYIFSIFFLYLISSLLMFITYFFITSSSVVIPNILHYFLNFST